MMRFLVLPGLLLALSSCSRPKTFYNGVIDDVSCDNIIGWAVDFARAAESIDVTVFDDDGLVNLRQTARLPRFNFEPGQQLHGFTIRTPAALRDGKSHFVHVAFEGTKAELRHSPRPLSCPAATAKSR